MDRAEQNKINKQKVDDFVKYCKGKIVIDEKPLDHKQCRKLLISCEYNEEKAQNRIKRYKKFMKALHKLQDRYGMAITLEFHSMYAEDGCYLAIYDTAGIESYENEDIEIEIH